MKYPKITEYFRTSSFKTYYLKDKVLIYNGSAVYSLPIIWEDKFKKFLEYDTVWLNIFRKTPRNSEYNADFFLIPKDERIGQVNHWRSDEILKSRKSEWKFELEITAKVVAQIVKNRILNYKIV